MIELTITITSKGFQLLILNPIPFDFQYPKDCIPFKVLRAAMIDIGLNIFFELDAAVYIYGIEEKIGSMEFHTYNCMDLFCLTQEFSRYIWNHEAVSDTILLNCCEIISDLKNIFVIKP